MRRERRWRRTATPNAHASKEAGSSYTFPHVMAAIRVEQLRRFQEGSCVALRVLDDIMGDPDASNRDKVAAARTVLEGGGFIGRTRVELESSEAKPLNEMTRDELAAFIAAERKAIAELEREAASNKGVIDGPVPRDAEDQADPINDIAGEQVMAMIENR